MLFKPNAGTPREASQPANAPIEGATALKVRIHQRLIELLNLSVLDKTPREALRLEIRGAVSACVLRPISRPRGGILAYREPHDGEASIIAIGASTGGVEALRHIFTALPGNLPPIGIVSDRRLANGTPLVLHNIARGTREENLLFQHAIIGHYRMP